MKYKEKKSFEDRQSESEEIFKKYPDRIPVIVEQLKNSKSEIIPDIDKSKFLVPKDLTVAQLMYIIRKRISLKPEQALFIFSGGNSLRSDMTIESVHSQFKDEDGFTYIVYSGESTFG